MSKHTPAPWLIDGRVIRSKFGGQICMFSTWISQTANETDGNARLIAAAPDLLGAAEEAERVIDILWASHHANRADAALDALRSAIAKATGGEP